MSEITLLAVIISFYVILPFFFLITRKKWKKAVKKQSLEELKRQKKGIKKGCIFVFFLIGVHIIFSYKHYSSYPIPSYPLHIVNFSLILLGMFYFHILYTFFIIIPNIKEKEREQEQEK